MKVYMFYFEGDLYALTSNKKFATKFKEQRCKDTIVCKTRNLTNDEFSLLSNKYNGKMLIENPFDTVKGYIDVVTTYDEDESVTTFITKLETDAGNSLNSYMKKIAFRKDIEEILQTGLQMLYHRNPKGEITMNLDAIAILIYLFEPTFTGCGKLKFPLAGDFNLNGLE